VPLQKIQLKSGANRENTRYTNENGWYETDKVRFRQGTPEKIGGWVRISSNYFLGVCRSLWNWVTLNSQNLLGIGTNLKFYIERQGVYYDVTPIQSVHTLTNPFTTIGGSPTVTVTDGLGGFAPDGFVTFNGATAVGGLTLNGEYQINAAVAGSFTITAATNALSGATGGDTVYAVYQLSASPSTVIPLYGWGAGTWGSGVWGTSGGAASLTTPPLAIWNQDNFGQNLIYGPRGSPLYYWDANIGYSPTAVTLSIASPCEGLSSLNLPDLTPIIFETTGSLPSGLIPGTIYYTRYLTLVTFNLSATPTGALIVTTGSQSGVHSISPRGVPISTLPGANATPLSQNFFIVSDTSRFVICFGANDAESTTVDPMLVRWSSQESVTDWYPSATNQAGSLPLSHGSKIVTALQSRQEIVVWTDSTLYSLQYLGPPSVWGSQLLADNISIAGPNAAALASGVVYWMGVDKFYKYDGRVQTLRCDLLRFIYEDINKAQYEQIYTSTNEGFTEVWFFYCTAASSIIDRYVVYNYTEDCWYYGNMTRSAWLDTGLRNYPLAATYDPETSTGNIVDHELGVDDGAGEELAPIEASITSAQFDIGDGHNFAFVWRMLPDLTFKGSTPGTAPALTIYLQPLKNSGSGYTTPASVGGVSTAGSAVVTGIVPVEVDEFTGQVFIRIRGRQMSMKISSNKLGTQWQLGSPRFDLRQDGRR
jgi:hypothetical protein